jgi:hypothetical protein
VENKTDEEKRKDFIEREKRALEERRRREEEARQEEEEEEEEERLRWDATARFKADIIKPPLKNKNANSMLKFTVWCSDGYDNDGWHSYQGEPTKEFDSSWNTKKEANDRAEYLFFWKNSWGLDPQEVNDDDGEPEPTERDGMMKWTVAPADSTRWTVGVVPASVYQHLENASLDRHNHDDEPSPRSDQGSRYALAF